jgi:hypothetical protein
MNQKSALALLALAITLVAWSPISNAADPGSQDTKPKTLPSYCPPPGTVVPLTKAMSESFIKDYKECDIVVEATFFKMGDDSLTSRYDKKANTIFQVLEPGGTPQSQLGMIFGTFAGTPKAKSSILFELKQGDLILLRGAPIRPTFMGAAMYPVFQAESVTRK